MLWKRSLVMVDAPTGSLWSHILGQAMQGPLKGTRLELLPGDMITWAAWRELHPKTTVLNLSRTHREYRKTFYRRPADFVLGWMANGSAYHCGMDVLLEKKVLSVSSGQTPLVVTFDTEGTAARLFSRQLDDRLLDFDAADQGRMRDRQTGSIWNAHTGKALSGPLAGSRLTHRVGIMSFARAWESFHPSSKRCP